MRLKRVPHSRFLRWSGLHGNILRFLRVSRRRQEDGARDAIPGAEPRIHRPSACPQTELTIAVELEFVRPGRPFEQLRICQREQRLDAGYSLERWWPKILDALGSAMNLCLLLSTKEAGLDESAGSASRAAAYNCLKVLVNSRRGGGGGRRLPHRYSFLKGSRIAALRASSATILSCHPEEPEFITRHYSFACTITHPKMGLESLVFHSAPLEAISQTTRCPGKRRSGLVPAAVFGEPGFRQRTAVPTKNSIGTKIWVACENLPSH
jgi:hypothetical protein